MQLLAFTRFDPPLPVLGPTFTDEIDLADDELDAWADGVLRRLETDWDVDLRRPVYVVGGTITVEECYGRIPYEINRYSEALGRAKDRLVDASRT